MASGDEFMSNPIFMGGMAHATAWVMLGIDVVA